MTDQLQAARDFVDDWLEAEDDTTARFVFATGVRRCWARLTPEEQKQLRAEVEPRVSRSASSGPVGEPALILLCGHLAQLVGEVLNREVELFDVPVQHIQIDERRTADSLALPVDGVPKAE